MDRKLIDYLPPVLRSVYEYKHITNAQQPEIEAAWDAAQMVLDNQFIDTADEAGVAVWEKELDITPLDNESLEARKHRIKAAWAYTTVYTYKWLVEWIRSSCGNRVAQPTVDGYVLTATLPIGVDYKRILQDMRRYISANVLINPRLLMSETRLNQYVGTALRQSVRQSATSSAWSAQGKAFLSDENGDVLIDGAGYVLFEEDLT